MELLESKAVVLERHGALSSDDFDGCTEVLEFGAFEHIGNLKVQLAGGDHGVGACDHVDGRLVHAGRTESVGLGVESDPVGRAL